MKQSFTNWVYDGFLQRNSINHASTFAAVTFFGTVLLGGQCFGDILSIATREVNSRSREPKALITCSWNMKTPPHLPTQKTKIAPTFLLGWHLFRCELFVSGSVPGDFCAENWVKWPDFNLWFTHSWGRRDYNSIYEWHTLTIWGSRGVQAGYTWEYRHPYWQYTPTHDELVSMFLLTHAHRQNQQRIL